MGEPRSAQHGPPDHLRAAGLALALAFPLGVAFALAVALSCTLALALTLASSALAAATALPTAAAARARGAACGLGLCGGGGRGATAALPIPPGRCLHLRMCCRRSARQGLLARSLRCHRRRRRPGGRRCGLIVEHRRGRGLLRLVLLLVELGFRHLRLLVRRALRGCPALFLVLTEPMQHLIVLAAAAAGPEDRGAIQVHHHALPQPSCHARHPRQRGRDPEWLGGLYGRHRAAARPGLAVLGAHGAHAAAEQRHEARRRQRPRAAQGRVEHEGVVGGGEGAAEAVRADLPEQKPDLILCARPDARKICSSTHQDHLLE
mmetsp:Transcript_103922/g.334931  ORF Transcript_103922/g.334931 Transcript_103922/m.334931 type:complete len:320 (+) Transcript_103922:66-1025(+)